MLVSAVVDCLNLTSPSNGQVSLTTTTFGSVATYSCEEGYLLEGFPMRECQANGNWSEEEPVCASKLLYVVHVCHAIINEHFFDSLQLLYVIF